MNVSHSNSADRSLRLQALDFVHDGAMITDEMRSIIYANAPMMRMLGQSPLDAPMSPGVLGACLRFAKAASFEEVLVLTERDGQWEGEATCATPWEPAVTLHIRTRRLSDSTGRHTGAIVVARDAAHERSMDKLAIMSYQMELIESLIGGMAHEFKNLLTVIMAYSTLLQDRQKDLALETAKILETAQRADQLTSRMLSITRPTAPHMESLDVHKVLSDLSAMLQKALPSSIELVLPSKAIMARVLCDPGIFIRVLLKLCLDARDAMPKGGKLTIELDHVVVGREDLDACPEARMGAFEALSINDTGGGMPAEVLNHIFDPFFSPRKDGAGIGLAVVRHMLQATGGWITADSLPDKGSSFRVFIPSASQDLSAFTDASEEGPPATGTETILVVDDDPLTLNIVQKFLLQSGFTVFTARSGEEAIRQYRIHAHDIDLVLLDVIMPHLNGEDVYHALVQIDPSVTIVAISGCSEEAVARFIRISGAHFLSKPFGRVRLTREVRKVLDLKKQRAS